MRKYGGDKYIPEVTVTAKGPGKIKSFYKKVGHWLSKNGDKGQLEGEGGHQKAGDHYVTSGDTGSPTKQTADDSGEIINIDDLLPAVKGIGKSPTPTRTPLTPASQIKRVGKVASEIGDATSGTSDADIVNSSATGSNADSSPENNTVVRTYSGEKDSAVVKLTVRIQNDTSIYRDKKWHKGSKKGRWVSEEYREK